MPITEILEPQVASVAGVPIRRLLPSRHRPMVGPFILMDQFGPLEIPAGVGGGVPEHPHAGLSTFTYLIEGSVHHRDSDGHDAIVRSGDVALMTAGSGITHEELPVVEGSSSFQRAFAVQMWLALPDPLEEMDPAFEHHTGATLPEVVRDGTTVRLGLGAFEGAVALTTCHVPTLFAEIRMEAGSTLPVRADYEEQAVMLLGGDVSVDGVELTEHRLAVLAGEQAVLSSSQGAHVLLLGGARFPSRRYIGGSFVASSPEKLRRWMHDSASGRWPRIAR